MTNEVTKTIWGGLISTNAAVVPPATLLLNSMDVDNGVLYTATALDITGNDVTVDHVVSGINTLLSVVVIGTDIVVNSATDAGGLPTTTDSEIVTAIIGSVDASALVSSAVVGTGSSILDAGPLATNLTGGVTTMRQHATTELTDGTPIVADSTDVSRAAAVGTTLSASIPNNDAKFSLDDDIGNGNLVSTLNSFLALYSQIRSIDFHELRTSWANGNGAAVTPDYSRTAFKTTPAVTIASDLAPGNAYDDIEVDDDIDISLYEAIIGTLNGVITTNSNKIDALINYCHSSCHSVCHSARGRR